MASADIFEFLRQGWLGHADQIVLGINGVAVSVAIEWEETHSIFGGHRPWWRCPDCRARRRWLFIKDGRASCRVCLALTYRSRWMRWAPSRPLRRAAKLRARIGANLQPFSSVPRRYNRVAKEIELLEREALGYGRQQQRRRPRRPGRC